MNNSTSQEDPQSVAALRFLREKCVYEVGARIKSGDVIRAFLEWCEDNNHVLDSQATNKISPLIQNAMSKFNDKVKINPIHSFSNHGHRTQSPGFFNLRVL